MSSLHDLIRHGRAHILSMPINVFIGKCLGFGQIPGNLQIHGVLIDSDTDLKKYPFFLNIACCCQMLGSRRNTLGSLQWGTLGEMARFIEFVMEFAQLTFIENTPGFAKRLRVRK
jgi:hypothetical protein